MYIMDYKMLNSNRKVVLGQNPAAGTFGNSNLGRPWQDYARVMFQNSDFTNTISPIGWQAWTSTQNSSNVLFAEYNNVNPAWSSARFSFAKLLSAPVAISAVLTSTIWIDSGYITLGAP